MRRSIAEGTTEVLEATEASMFAVSFSQASFFLFGRSDQMSFESVFGWML
jgi:hypothetical protein